MIATFAFIGLFAVGSVDAIITGGADFDTGATAYAMEYPASRVTDFAPAVPHVDPPQPVETLKAADVDYSFTTEALLGAPELDFAFTAEPLFEDFTRSGEKTEPVATPAADLSTF